MSQHAADHAWDTSHTLEKDKPCEPLLLCHLESCIAFLAWFGVSVACDEIHPPTQHSYRPEG